MWATCNEPQVLSKNDGSGIKLAAMKYKQMCKKKYNSKCH
jgi:hypothetical protein